MKFLVAECASGNLLLHPIGDESRTLELWERYRLISQPEAFERMVWRVVEARHVEQASKIVRADPSTPSHPMIKLPDIPKDRTSDDNDGPDRNDRDGWRRERQPGDRGRGRITSKRTEPSGDPWDC